MNGISRPEQISILQKLNPDIAIIPEMKKSNIDIVKPDDATLNKCVEKTLSKGGAFLYKDVSVFFNIPLPSIYSYI